jgi:hypothetical protein
VNCEIKAIKLLITVEGLSKQLTLEEDINKVMDSLVDTQEEVMISMIR